MTCATSSRSAAPTLLERCLELVGEDPFARVEESTRFQQPAIFCASIAGWRGLPDDVEPAVAAGHSLGELAALAAAGVLTVDDALELVVLRGRLMAEADDRGSMLALVGADDAEARAGRRGRRAHRRQRQRARPDRPRRATARASTAPRRSPASSASARSGCPSPAPSTRPRWRPPSRRSAPRSTTSSCTSRASPSTPARPPRRSPTCATSWRGRSSAPSAGARRSPRCTRPAPRASSRSGPGKVLARLAKRIVPGTKVETPAEAVPSPHA